MALEENNNGRRYKAPLELWVRVTFLTLGSIVVTMIGLMFITFIIGRVMPIDPVLAIVGEQASKSTYDEAVLKSTGSDAVTTIKGEPETDTVSIAIGKQF